jgi:hypothetical protein
MLKKIMMMGLLAVSPMFAVNKGMLNISDLDVEIAMAFDVGQFQEDYAVDTYFVGFSFLDTNDGAGPSLVTGDILVINEMPQLEGSKLGFGMKVISTESGTESFLAVPIGAVLDYKVSDTQQLFWKSGLFYAPGALSFKDSRSYFEARTTIEMEAIENVRVFVGARGIYTNYQSGNIVTVNETIFGGMQVGF